MPHLFHGRRAASLLCTMTLLGSAAAYLALHQASARTDASREALRAAGVGMKCSPVGDQSSIDDALAIVDVAVAKVMCWTAPLPLPTDEGDVDISPLLGADNKGGAISAHRDRLEYVYHGNEHRLYLSSEYCSSGDDTVRALQEAIVSRARASCVELKTKRRTYIFKDKTYPYIECKCKHRSSDGQCCHQTSVLNRPCCIRAEFSSHFPFCCCALRLSVAFLASNSNWQCV